ncbi:hypothetical protein D9758_007522 [Tetrapyrgos nigripes]|uniref:Uncharacterized protein n=1 Tax=Tetrapyrgos nigripes TaxID=182062 RepID=A0A8H5G3B4_9AGAR|nr:hypothetical protein D9758_007522 [Tetrapyrgos nigripes]
MGFGFGTPQRVEVDSGARMENATLPLTDFICCSTYASRFCLPPGVGPGCECAGAVTGIERQSEARETWRHHRDTRLPPELTGSSDYGGGVSGKGVRWDVVDVFCVGRLAVDSKLVKRLGIQSGAPIDRYVPVVLFMEDWQISSRNLRATHAADGYKLGKPKKTFLPSTFRFTPSDNLLKGGRPNTAYDMLDSSPSSNWKQPLYAPSVKKCTPPDSPSFRNSRSTLVDGLARGTFNDSPCPFPLHNVVPQPLPDYTLWVALQIEWLDQLTQNRPFAQLDLCNLFCEWKIRFLRVPMGSKVNEKLQIRFAEM